MGGKGVAITCCAALLALAPREALAEDPTDSSAGELSPSYLWDGGALPFIWGSLAARVMLDKYGTPRETPLLFDASEGGATPADWELPGWSISALGGVAAVGMIAGGDRSRSYHVKGLAEALSTGVLVTGLIKVAVGRHRPDWSSEVNSDVSRRSFPSGHATQAFAIATYSILYLHGHVFDKDDGLSAGEVASYGAILLGATALTGERVYHNRHHISDVTVGGLLGSATSTLFYLYQERRFRRHELANRAQVLVSPTDGGASVGVSTVW